MIFGLFLLFLFFIGVLFIIINIKDEQNNVKKDSDFPFNDGFFAI